MISYAKGIADRVPERSKYAFREFIKRDAGISVDHDGVALYFFRADGYFGEIHLDDYFYNAGDPGWRLKSTNLADQIAELESKGADGYVLFCAKYLFESCAAQELSNIRGH